MLSTILSKIIHEQEEEKQNKFNKSNLGPWAIRDSFRVNHKGERTFKMEFNEGTKKERKTIEAVVKFLKENVFNVKIIGLDVIDVVFQEVTVDHLGNFDIQINIKEHSIFKAKYYQTPEGNIRVLKSNGGVTHIVNF